ncbi:WecB/TagA/CpsF family glycosyltransferase [Ferviditalea candida]|uniref:N-acetylglucosaminyldiphosphoundecaprenol N-acetyl-beta-D-mannosaminyltransferase n=1 Tax=Ferviditalea candida TaxID=3108399 RepID=A0ABU5ZJS5_9BACL|nr:WecB/TagA/CpsF family glycosyltransferase [Paenibacillaceae bacterium T2]
MMIPTVSLFGIPVCKWGMEDTVRYLTKAVEERRKHQVITANPIMVMAGLNDPKYLAMMKRAELIVPDGAGVVWAASHIGDPVAERVSGFDLMHRLLTVGEERGWKVFLLGASPDIISASYENLHKRYTALRIEGWRDGYFGAEQDDEVINQINAAQPDLLFVGRSADKQEPWIDRYKERLDVPLMMGVGGSFDVISGKLKRAPVWIQRVRMEWFYRLLQEPWRYRRMLELPKFVVRVVRDLEKVQ